MTTLNDFKALRASVPAEVQKELYSLFSQDPEASFQRMVDIAAEKGVTLKVDEVKGFLKQMDEDSEFDDIELDAVALAAVVLMATLEEFKALRAGVAPKVQTELYGLMSSDPEAGKQRMVEIAAGQGVTLTTEEVRGFLLQMDDEEEFDDIELDPIALTAIAGWEDGAASGS